MTTRFDIALSARVCVLLAGLAVGAPSVAQTEPPATAPVTVPAGQDVPASIPVPPLGPIDVNAIPAGLKARLCTAMTRTALLDVRGIAEPTETDLALTSAYLRRASEMNPGNTQTIRRWIEAAFAAGDDATVLEASRALVRQDPSDTVALLRVISSQLRNANTAQDRLAAYERFLASGKLDESVRSRLALDAALLSREVGDEKKFLERLKQATQLDSTNKDAAVLLFTYVSQRAKTDFERVEALNNLLMADPADAGVHAQFRDLLARNGAWNGAARFDQNVRRMVTAGDPEGLTPEDRLVELAIVARRDTPGVSLDELNRDLDAARDRQDRIFKSTDKKDQETFNIRRPEEIRLAAVLEELRLACAVAASRPGDIDTSLADMQASAEEAIATLKDPIRRGQDVSEADAALAATDIEANWALWQLLSNHKVSDAQARVEKLLETLAEVDPRVPELKAWSALRKDDAAGALAIAQGDAPSAWLGAAHAAALISQGKKAEAISQLTAIESAEPLSGLGVWATWQLGVLGYQADNPLRKQIESYVRTIPAWVDSVVTAPATIQRLSIDHEKSNATASERVPVIVRLKNLAPVPLGLGPQRTVDSRMLLSPDVRVNPTAFANFAQPEVLDFARVLRLRPGEEMRVVFDPSDTMIGWVTETISQGPSATRLRIMQGFTTNDEGKNVAGPGCLDVATGTLTRQPSSEARLTPEQLAERLRTANDEVLPSLLLGVRALFINALAQGEGGPNIAPILQALEVGYVTWSPQMRLLAVLELPAPGEIPALAGLSELMKNETDPTIMSWVLLTRVGAPEDAFITKCEQAGDANLAKLATMTRERLTAKTKTYAIRGALGSVQTGGASK
ncbi:MAG TPA: hypothetical protein VK157_03075 [Phycisphaerales bacterium]|nr:hypothetical protein [Phycisphaerales bacterium]